MLQAFGFPPSRSLIFGAGQAYMLQLFGQALALLMVVQAPLSLQLQLLRNALEFSLEFQVRVLPREPFDPSLGLEALPTLEFQLLRQRPAFFAQQL